MVKPSERPQETKPVDAPLPPAPPITLESKLYIALFREFVDDCIRAHRSLEAVSFPAWVEGLLWEDLTRRGDLFRQVDPGIVAEQEEHNREEEGGLCD